MWSCSVLINREEPLLLLDMKLQSTWFLFISLSFGKDLTQTKIREMTPGENQFASFHFRAYASFFLDFFVYFENTRTRGEKIISASLVA